MECVIKKVFKENIDDEVHRYFIRFGKGTYGRRFLLKLMKTKKVKLRGSFEYANDFVEFVKEIKPDTKFSGFILSKTKIEGKAGKKNSKGFIYELSEEPLEGFEDAHTYLLNVNDEDIVLKIKKKLPKPGKSEGKIDDKFCSLDLDPKYWEKAKEAFFWDLPECKKASVEHEVFVNEIILPEGEDDPVKVRENAKRKGTLKRKIIINEEDSVKEIDLLV